MKGRIAAFILVISLQACGEGPADPVDLPDAWTLESPGITVAIAREPVGFAVAETAQPPTLPEATDEATLADCEPGCWRRDDLGGGLERLRVTHGDGTTMAGGVTFRASTGRRTRWDVFLAR